MLKLKTGSTYYIDLARAQEFQYTRYSIKTLRRFDVILQSSLK